MSRKTRLQLEQAEKVEYLAPLPLRREMAIAAPYPIKALGKLLSDAATAIMDKVQCPDAIACQSVLGAAAVATQAHIDVVHPALGEALPISLFLFTIASSGERKSAADKLALGPLRLREAELYSQHQTDVRIYVDAKALYERAREAILRSKEQSEAKSKALTSLHMPHEPLVPLLLVPEPTLEGLHKLLAKGEPSMGLFSDEGGGFIGGHGMTEEARLRTSAGLSDMWGGTPIKRVRGGDGITIVKGRRLSLHLMAQPGIAEFLLTDPVIANQGLPSRILVSAPNSLSGRRLQRKPKTSTEPALKRYQERMLRLLRHKQRRAGPADPALNPRQLVLSARARMIWSAFADECERALGEGGPYEPIKAFANKLGEHALRIAAVLEMVDGLEARDLSGQAMERGVEIARYYASEALRLFEAGMASPEIQRAEKLLKWLHETWREPTVSLANIYQRGPNSIRDAARAREAAAILEQHNWLRPVSGGTVIDGKRHKEVWEVIKKPSG